MQGRLNVQTAAQAAWLIETFADESITSPRLEEVRLEAEVWKITISFVRDGSSLMDAFQSRTFKVIQIDDRTGDIVSLTHRDLGNRASG